MPVGFPNTDTLETVLALELGWERWPWEEFLCSRAVLPQMCVIFRVLRLKGAVNYEIQNFTVDVKGQGVFRVLDMDALGFVVPRGCARPAGPTQKAAGS